MLTIYANPQRSFYDHLLAGALAQHPLLAKTDAILNSVPDLLEPFIAAYAKDRQARHVDEDFGRGTISLESVVRLLIVKRLHKECPWRDVEEHAKTDYAWKAFAKLSVIDTVPDHTTLIKWEQFFGEEALRSLHAAVMAYAVGKKIVKGRTFRTDTTVVPANIHYPTDASLLGDAMRVVTRTVQKIKKIVELKTVFRSRMRMVKQKLIRLGHALKTRATDAKAKATRTTAELLLLATSVLANARKINAEWARNGRDAAGRLAKQFARHLAVSQKLIQQTGRVLAGKKVQDRIVSFFQPSMRPIVKGKLFPPCEFGRKVIVDETDGNLVSDWTILNGNPNDATLLRDRLDRHKDRFGHDPTLVATDRGFWSAENREKLTPRVPKLSIPQRGYKTKTRLRAERSRWFRKAQDWRAGGEARQSWLKRTFGWGHSRAKTEAGYDRGIGWGVLGCNLKVLALRI